MSETLVHERYRLVELIGKGGVGEVWKAENVNTGQTVAIKKIHPTIARDEVGLKRFEREANLLHQLDHPNIIHVLAFFEERGHYYLVMQYMSGGSLYELVRHKGALPIPEVRRIGLGVSKGLAQAHRMGIVHRDIKLENILFDEDDTPALTDFGFARYEGGTALTKTGFVVGTLNYLSPEECQGYRADERSDIWRLGILFYEMLTGASPFERQGLEQTITAILTEPVPPLTQYRADIPGELLNLVDVMLQKDPGYRISSARLVASALKLVPDTARRGSLDDLRPVDEAATS
ncbi:MAG: serine/threonine protein kinase [Anaerolineae bacterium]|nr:serine/threonine protein kinase [Anaerolineae bacterium]